MEKVIIKYPHERSHNHSLTFDERCDLVRSTVLRPDMTSKERFEILKKRYMYSENEKEL